MTDDQKDPRGAERRLRRDYAPDADRPLVGYAGLMTAYAVGAGALAAAVRRKGAAAIGLTDFALITIATQRASRTLAKDAVASPLRAPVTRYEGQGLPSEVNEEVKPSAHGPARQIQHAIGELVTCPFCLGQWVATGLVGSQLLAPRFTRAVTCTLAAATGANALQFAYAALERLGDS